MAKAKAKQQVYAAHGKSGLYKPKQPRPLDDFDLDALAVLPDEGAMKGRYIHDALTVPQLRKKLDAPELSSGFVSMRIRDLFDRGLVVPVATSIPGQSGKKGWQRTEEGRKAAMGRIPATHDDDGEQAAEV